MQHDDTLKCNIFKIVGDAPEGYHPMTYIFRKLPSHADH